MTPDSCRLATGPILYCRPCDPRPLPKVTNELQRNGLRYQKRVTTALASVCKRRGATLTAEPWFQFEDANGRGQIVPDATIAFYGTLLVVEIKTTFVPVAITKLTGLYIPLIEMTTKTRVLGLVICKNITPDAPHLIDGLAESFSYRASVPVLQWLGHGPIRW